MTSFLGQMNGHNCPTRNRRKVNFGVYFLARIIMLLIPNPPSRLPSKAFAASIFNGDVELVFGGFAG